MDNSDIDAAFSSLPLHLRNRIDRAFDQAISQSEQSSSSSTVKPYSKSKTCRNEVNTEPGGFIVDQPTPGGFIADDPPAGGFLANKPQQGGFAIDNEDEEESIDQSETTHTRIPFSLIPTALQLLDLQPDDEDVLDVFRNAASGWENQSRTASFASSSELFVERRDWRGVCTALLEPLQDRASEGERDIEMEDRSQRDEDEESGGGSEDEYQDPGAGSETGSDSFGNDSDDEYTGTTAVSTKAKGKSKAIGISNSKSHSRKRGTVLSDEDEEPINALNRVTPRQKKECRRMYALFFPDVEDEDLNSRRLMIKDIAQVAKVLKEKITVEEIIEMLEAFSSKPDKSMDLGDFERMMITAKLA